MPTRLLRTALAAVAASAALVLATSLPARADVALQFSSFSLRIDQQTTFGWAFTLSTPLVVTDLGYYDFGSDGLSDAHPVAIWTSTGGAPLVTASVPAGMGGTLVNGSRYVPVTPTLLAAGSYTIGGYSPALTDSVAINAATITTAPGITYVGSRSAQGVGLTFPSGDTQGYTNGDFGPNFQFSNVPEPSAGALVLAGAGLFWVIRRGRKKARASVG